MQAASVAPAGVPSDSGLKLKLSRALLHFQDRLLEGNITPGSLCQVWMPGTSEEGEQVLKAKGQPYCAAGVVDLLALFRCISCRYCFSTDLTKPELLGAPGRVFTSRQPEMTRNVQHQSKDVYLRAQEAMHCRVHSTLVLPLYRTAERESVAGVLEVIQTSEDMVFAQLVDILSEELERCNLYTVDDIQRAQLRKKAPELLAASGSTSKADNSTHISTSQNGSTNGSPKSINVPAPETGLPEVVDETSSQLPSTLSHRLPETGDSSLRGGAGPGITTFIQAQPMVPQPEMGMQMRGSSEAAAALQLSRAPSLGMVTRHSGQANAVRSSFVPVKSMEVEDSKTSSYYDEEEIGSEDGWDDDLEDSAEGAGDEATRAANRRRGKGTGNPGKPGKKLRLADLQSQFGVGLKEAANKLGICPTTLKRACRRHGIQRWPRRQLARLTRAIDQIRSSGSNAVPVVERPLRSSSRGKAASDEPMFITSPSGSFESFPSASTGVCHSEPGADTRWTALDQLVPNFDHTNPDSKAVNDQGNPSTTATTQAMLQPPATSPSLLPAQCQDSPNVPLSFSPTLISTAPPADVEFGAQLSMPSLAADAWAVSMKADPWESAKASVQADLSHHGHTVQEDGNDSCCMSLGDTITCGRASEEESVHGAFAFQQAMSSHPARSGFASHASSGLPPLLDSQSQLTAADYFNQGALNIPMNAGLRSATTRGMAASHSPGLAEGMLAQSLQSVLPQGVRRLPQSLPTMLSAAYSQANFRHSLAMQLGQGSIAHSMSLSNLHHDMLLQRDHSLNQEALGGLGSHPTADSGFGMLQKEEQNQFCDATGLHIFSGEDAVMSDGLDGDMLEMLLPEES